jgi:hypothetical protein
MGGILWRYGAKGGPYGLLLLLLNEVAKLSSAAKIFLKNGRIVLIVAVVLAAVQVVSLVFTAALSASMRNRLRGEGRMDVLPKAATDAPKDVAFEGRGAAPITA